MGNDLAALLAADGPEAREIVLSGKTVTAFFKRITAGQRAQLLKGQRVSTKAGEGSTVEIDLGDNESTKLQMVQFCVVTEDGKPFFKTLGEVQRLDASKVNVLYRHVQEVNAEDEDAGKS